MKEKHNGWTNYATWRVNMEILGDIEFDEIVSADSLKKIVEDVVFSQYDGMNSLMYDYARAFISEVNFYEIAQSINEELELQTKYDD
jgi:arginine decarboxylase-like protein